MCFYVLNMSWREREELSVPVCLRLVLFGILLPTSNEYSFSKLSPHLVYFVLFCSFLGILGIVCHIYHLREISSKNVVVVSCQVEMAMEVEGVELVD